MLDRQVEITTETAAIYKENVRVMEAMKIAGMTTEAAVAQMRAASHQVEASLMDLKRQVRETENSLAVLLAKAPQTMNAVHWTNRLCRKNWQRVYRCSYWKPSGREDAEMTLAVLIIPPTLHVQLSIRA